MLTSFMLGGLGTLLRLAGVLVLFLSALDFILHGPSAPIILILGIVLIVLGSYAKYVSQHSVRITK